MNRLALALTGALALTAPAQADDGAEFLTKLGGAWAGSGSITTDAGAAPGATTCRLQGAPSGSSISITGKCDGAAKGANLAVILNWSDAQKSFAGTFQGGAETGTASLSGRLSGNTLTMRVSSENGATSTLSLTLSGANRITLQVSGKDQKTGKPVNFVSLGLSKA